VISSKFVLSAASSSDFPRTGLPEIAMMGRSNVGKSTLINALVQKTIARTSAAPGKTRLANYYLIDDAFYLVDLPGYGYARGGHDAVEEFETLTAQYFDPPGDANRTLGGVLHLIDSRHPDLPQDLAAHRWVTNTGLPAAIVATKLDKLKQSGRARTLQILHHQYKTQILTTTAPDGGGIKELWKLLRTWVDPR
jgi:GTP-binding protein